VDPNLVTWTTAQDLGLQALDALDASCVPFGFCTMTYTRSNLLDPKEGTLSFTVNHSTGWITFGSSRSSAFVDVPRGTGITASRVAGNPSTQNWLMAVTRTGSNVGDLSVPSYHIYARMDSADPPGLYDGDNFYLPSHPGEPYLVSTHRARIVSDPWDVDWTYIISTH
jgi:hypothetical protein